MAAQCLTSDHLPLVTGHRPLVVYRPRSTEMTRPKPPTTVKPRIRSIGGNPPAACAGLGSNVGRITGGAGVKVGGRVGGIGFRLNCAARGGSVGARLGGG